MGMTICVFFIKNVALFIYSSGYLLIFCWIYRNVLILLIIVFDMRKISFFIAVLFSVLSLSGQDSLVDSLVGNMQRQVYNFPQEKVHIMTDKSAYFCGDTIWFRGFVVDASSHVPVSASKYLYVELVNPFDTVVSRVKVMERNGEYSGFVAVDALCPEGDYNLVAYTMFMNNCGSDFFFRKQISLNSPFSVQSEIHPVYEWEGDVLSVTVGCRDKSTGVYRKYSEVGYTTCDNVRRIRRSGGERTSFKLKGKELEKHYVLVSFGKYEKFMALPHFPDSDFSVSFHPEGGYLVPEKECRVAFKAVGSDGLGTDVSGRITDGSGNTVCSVSSVHKGMGEFFIKPSPGVRYNAEFTDESGKTKSFILPEVNGTAAVIRLVSSGDSIFVSSSGKTPDGSFVIVQQRGVALAAAPIDNLSPQFFLKSWFPAGVTQVLLLDAMGNVLSERMFFVRDSSNSAAVVVPDSVSYGNRSKVSLDIRLDGYEAACGSVAVAVTDDRLVDSASSLPIDAQLLLQSDLAGFIESPSWYFENSDDETDSALDLLMLTQGWRRYDMPEVMHGNFTYPSEPLEVGQEISGEVKRLLSGKPRQGVNMNVISPKVNFSNSAFTDADGKYVFSGFDYPENTSYIIQALDKDGDNILNFEVFDCVYPFTGFVLPSDEKDFDKKVDSDNETLMLNANPAMREILLDEVTVIGHRPKKYEDIYEILSSNTFNAEYMKDNNITSLEEVIRMIPGIREDGGFLYYRNGIVAFMVDGVFEDGTAMANRGRIALSGSYRKNTERSDIDIAVRLQDMESKYSMDIIDRVDFLTPSMAVFLGSKATTGGVIVITTKDGEERPKGEVVPYIKVFTPLGYQKPVEFYSPEYTPLECKPDGSDLRSTVYWTPSLEIGDDGIGHVEFYSTDMQNTVYHVRVEGVASDGKIVKGEGEVKIGM